jgi:hypothetical protein
LAAAITESKKPRPAWEKILQPVVDAINNFCKSHGWETIGTEKKVEQQVGEAISAVLNCAQEGLSPASASLSDEGKSQPVSDSTQNVTGFLKEQVGEDGNQMPCWEFILRHGNRDSRDKFFGFLQKCPSQMQKEFTDGIRSCGTSNKPGLYLTFSEWSVIRGVETTNMRNEMNPEWKRTAPKAIGTAATSETTVQSGSPQKDPLKESATPSAPVEAKIFSAPNQTYGVIDTRLREIAKNPIDPGVVAGLQAKFAEITDYDAQLEFLGNVNRDKGPLIALQVLRGATVESPHRTSKSETTQQTLKQLHAMDQKAGAIGRDRMLERLRAAIGDGAPIMATENAIYIKGVIANIDETVREIVQIRVQPGAFDCKSGEFIHLMASAEKHFADPRLTPLPPEFEGNRPHLKWWFDNHAKGNFDRAKEHCKFSPKSPLPKAVIDCTDSCKHFHSLAQSIKKNETPTPFIATKCGAFDAQAALLEMGHREFFVQTAKLSYDVMHSLAEQQNGQRFADEYWNQERHILGDEYAGKHHEKPASLASFQMRYGSDAINNLREKHTVVDKSTGETRAETPQEADKRAIAFLAQPSPKGSKATFFLEMLAYSPSLLRAWETDGENYQTFESDARASYNGTHAAVKATLQWLNGINDPELLKQLLTPLTELPAWMDAGAETNKSTFIASVAIEFYGPLKELMTRAGLTFPFQFEEHSLRTRVCDGAPYAKECGDSVINGTIEYTHNQCRMEPAEH